MVIRYGWYSVIGNTLWRTIVIPHPIKAARTESSKKKEFAMMTRTLTGLFITALTD
jgi:hypothetical protein